MSVGDAVLFFFCYHGVARLTVLVPMDAMHFFFWALGQLGLWRVYKVSSLGIGDGATLA